MPLSLKERSSRLQAFVRKNSEDAAAAAQEEGEAAADKQQDAPQISLRSPTRQELAEAAKLSLPTALRNGGAMNRQQGGLVAGRTRPVSPPRATQASPAPSQTRQGSGEHNGALFSGSQLGEDFMNSGLSTPQNEAESSEGEATPNAKNDQPARPDNTDRGFKDAPPAAAFRIEENLMMSIVPSSERRVLPQMMDGFRDDTLPATKRHTLSHRHQYNRPPSTALLRPALPTREVRVKRFPAISRPAAYEKRDVNSSSPSTDRARWQGQRKADDARQTGTVIELEEEEEEEELGSLPAHEEPASPTPARRDLRKAARRTAGGSPTPANVAPQKLPRERKRRRYSADYDDNMLSSMTYGDLQNEPFDLDPAKAASQNGQDASATLPLKLEQHRQQGEKEQKHMFETMSIDDWEASGDWFVEQFTVIMKRLRDARRRKRRMIQAFEDEAARREEAVRLRSETIDRKLVKMRQNGQRVVEDKGA